MASRKPINEQQLLRERLRSVSIDLESDVEYLERRCSRLLWDLQELSKVLGQVEGCLGADAERAPVTPSPHHLAEKLRQSKQGMVRHHEAHHSRHHH